MESNHLDYLGKISLDVDKKILEKKGKF